MKITPKKYAQVLYELTEGKNKKEIKDILENFAGFLVDNRDISKADKIIDQFGKIWNKKNRTVEAKAVTSTETDEQTLAVIENYIKNISNARKVELKHEIDKRILGGVVIRYEDKLIDAGLKTQVKNLKSFLVK
ncbi:MAG: ATP synthase F1 subunit delta [Patescibacteria group bacterium]